MALRTFDYGAMATIAISVIGGVFWLGSLSAKVDAVDTGKLDNKLSAALQKIEGAEQKITDQLPVGTVIASILEPKIFLSNGRNKKWHLADDSAIPLDSAYKKIVENANIAKKDRLPDLRGVFLRGMNVGRSDGKEDPEGSKRVAGSFQASATKLPRSAFTGVTNVAGKHTHSHKAPRNYNSGGGDHARAKPDGSSTTNPSGNHKHTVTINGGGDVETRPRNVAIYFYIKVN